MSLSNPRWLFIFVPLMAAVMFSLHRSDCQLKSDPANCRDAAGCRVAGLEIGSPVICFEFVWTTEKADAMLASWSSKLHYLTFSLGLDFLFLLLYPLVLFLVLQLIAKHASLNWLKALAAFFAPVVLASGLFDAVENICLLRYIFGHRVEWLLKMAGVFAGIKVGLLALSGVVILAYLLAMLFKWVKSKF